MLAVTGSEHGNSYLQLVYRVVGLVVVYRTGMLAVTGSEHGNSYLQLVYRVVGVVVVYRTGMLAVRIQNTEIITYSWSIELLA